MMTERKEPYNEIDNEIDRAIYKPIITYRLYEQEPGNVRVVTITDGDERGYTPQRFVSKPFYTLEGISLAHYGYKLLQGIALDRDERDTLRRFLI